MTAVTGGNVVTPAGVRRADVTVSGGRVAAIGHAGPGGHQVDAAGCWVIPGGVDPHAHAMADLPRATAAAARGGTTTVLSFTNPADGEDDLACLLRRRDEVAGHAVVDVGLHACLYQAERATRARLAAMREAGAAAVKVFLAYPEFGIMCSSRALLRVMTAVRQLGLPVAVHCESGPLIEELLAAALAAHRAALRPRVFADTRPPETEAAAVAQTLALAALTGATTYLVHLSARQALEQVRLARGGGTARVLAEACLPHLVLDDRVYGGPAAGQYLVAPPLRAGEHVGALWQGLADGTIDTVGSDHCETRSATRGALAEAGGHYEFGLAGIDARLPLLLSAGLARGLPITRLVQLGCENPARAFGLYPRKGALTPGSDADLVVFDPAAGGVLGDGPYAGQRVRGAIRAVLSRGRLVEPGQPARGEFITPPGAS